MPFSDALVPPTASELIVLWGHACAECSPLSALHLGVVAATLSLYARFRLYPGEPLPPGSGLCTQSKRSEMRDRQGRCFACLCIRGSQAHACPCTAAARSPHRSRCKYEQPGPRAGPGTPGGGGGHRRTGGAAHRLQRPHFALSHAARCRGARARLRRLILRLHGAGPPPITDIHARASSLYREHLVQFPGHAHTPQPLAGSKYLAACISNTARAIVWHGAVHGGRARGGRRGGYWRAWQRAGAGLVARPRPHRPRCRHRRPDQVHPDPCITMWSRQIVALRYDAC